MSDKSIDKVLQEFFPKSARADWEKIAMLEIDGKAPNEFLSWHGKDDILYLPYYDTENVAHPHLLSRFQIPPSDKSFSGPWSWINLPAIIANHDKTANTQALHQLSLGADGVLFDVRQRSDVNVHALMQDIEWAHCFVGFNPDPISFPDLLSAFIQENFDPASLNGALFWESIPKKNNLDYYFNYCNTFKTLGLIIPPAAPVVEISNALRLGVETFDRFSGQSNPGNVFKSISFSVSVDTSFIESMAKLKALRMLWYQVAHAYGIKDYKLTDLHIQATLHHGLDEHDLPHDSMLPNTFSSMAAVLGGCDSLTIHTSAAHASLSRLALHVSNILRNEAFFDRVADPVAGAYAIDAIMDTMAKKAWEVFQAKSDFHDAA